MRFGPPAAILAVILSVGGGPAQAAVCLGKSMTRDEIVDAINATPGCARAMKLFQDCEFSTSGDIALGAAVEKKCEGDFLARLKAPQKQAYAREMDACDRKYRNEFRHHVSLVHGLLPRGSRPALLATGAESRGTIEAPLAPQAASAALAFSAIAWNAAGSVMARSDSTLRSTMMPDFARPLIKTL